MEIIIVGFLFMIVMSVMSSTTKDEKKKEEYKQTVSDFWNGGTGGATMRVAESIDRHRILRSAS
ncbi:hypothetical protein [Anoxynatronum sibiricum]|uniref:Uncharacterized protein n=1 Tax=Anoxynatronum sibiricum TaxID=210623 RepID=A0ABU9VSX0_9CLOT